MPAREGSQHGSIASLCGLCVVLASATPWRAASTAERRGASARGEAVEGLVEVRHVAGRRREQRRLVPLERGGRRRVLRDLGHHGLARAVEIVAVLGDELARGSQAGEIAVKARDDHALALLIAFADHAQEAGVEIHVFAPEPRELSDAKPTEETGGDERVIAQTDQRPIHRERRQHPLLIRDSQVFRESLGLPKPMVQVDKGYVFEGPTGQATLLDLFGLRRQLIVYHFMFDPGWDEGCKSRSHCADNFEGAVVHLAARDTAFAAVSRAPLQKIEAFKRRMGWTFPWVSSFGTTFNYDFHVSLDPAEGSTEYNYADAGALHQAGKLWSTKGELPGLSVFLRDGKDDVFHTYSTYQRGLDLLLNTYNYLDLTLLGRQEEGERAQAWLRHHDRYPT
jgi:predicted dithiol-disulfide oxidoreductase (DUF899 family)